MVSVPTTAAARLRATATGDAPALLQSLPSSLVVMAAQVPQMLPDRMRRAAASRTQVSDASGPARDAASYRPAGRTIPRRSRKWRMRFVVQRRQGRRSKPNDHPERRGSLVPTWRTVEPFTLLIISASNRALGTCRSSSRCGAGRPWF